VPAVAHASEAPAVAWVAVAGVLPLIAVSATAFAKISVVLGILRGGLGVPGALPAPVVGGLAAVLAALVMTPVATRVADAVKTAPEDAAGLAQAAERAWPPLADFLDRHTRPDDRALVADVTAKLGPAPAEPTPAMRVAAFLVSELTAAFTLGVLVLLPFLVVDLLVANTLAVIGFHQLPPPLVALPFKLLLFVAAGGWGLIVRGLVESYA
jgi:flagellar biosynthesis protein FliP